MFELFITPELDRIDRIKHVNPVEVLRSECGFFTTEARSARRLAAFGGLELDRINKIKQDKTCESGVN